MFITITAMKPAINVVIPAATSSSTRVKPARGRLGRRVDDRALIARAPP
jgi:hypothetical protein